MNKFFLVMDAAFLSHFLETGALLFCHTGNLTGMVGTALYVSPEVQGSTKSTYNQVWLE